MRNILQWAMAAALICSTTVFTSCTKDDNPATPDLNLSEKIIGKWMTMENNGQPSLTNTKVVITFVSTTKAYVSASRNDNSDAAVAWDKLIDADVAISSNTVTLTSVTDDHTTKVDEFVVTNINNNEFTANHKITISVDGYVVISVEDTVRLTKQTADYREAILGTWEGHVTNSEGSEYDDGETHRWEYKADGTYVYYVKDGDDWVPYADNTLNEYFVDGNLLCTRWIDQGQENREWWEITISGDKMNWTALRQKEDGTTFTATFEMKKVQ